MGTAKEAKEVSRNNVKVLNAGLLNSKYQDKDKTQFRVRYSIDGEEFEDIAGTSVARISAPLMPNNSDTPKARKRDLSNGLKALAMQLVEESPETLKVTQSDTGKITSSKSTLKRVNEELKSVIREAIYNRLQEALGDLENTVKSQIDSTENEEEAEKLKSKLEVIEKSLSNLEFNPEEVEEEQTDEVEAGF